MHGQGAQCDGVVRRCLGQRGPQVPRRDEGLDREPRPLQLGEEAGLGCRQASRPTQRVGGVACRLRRGVGELAEPLDLLAGVRPPGLAEHVGGATDRAGCVRGVRGVERQRLLQQLGGALGPVGVGARQGVEAIGCPCQPGGDRGDVVVGRDREAGDASQRPELSVVVGPSAADDRGERPEVDRCRGECRQAGLRSAVVDVAKIGDQLAAAGLRSLEVGVDPEPPRSQPFDRGRQLVEAEDGADAVVEVGGLAREHGLELRAGEERAVGRDRVGPTEVGQARGGAVAQQHARTPVVELRALGPVAFDGDGLGLPVDAQLGGEVDPGVVVAVAPAVAEHPVRLEASGAAAEQHLDGFGERRLAGPVAAGDHRQSRARRQLEGGFRPDAPEAAHRDRPEVRPAGEGAVGCRGRAVRSSPEGSFDLLAGGRIGQGIAADAGGQHERLDLGRQPGAVRLEPLHDFIEEGIVHGPDTKHPL